MDTVEKSSGQKRKTRPSETVLQIFMAAGHPVSAREVFERGRHMHATLGIATVYRCIRRFMEEGILREIHLPDVGTRYEYVTPEHHHYFHCNLCGHLYALAGCAEMLESMLPAGFIMESHEIILRGRCNNCAKPRNITRKESGKK
ncbi:MAG TPA: transcriptional repressor [Candidatus Hydrogenedentes bacterium]|nr:transcriptional repressor [Candidatus Hydrogenedentota bacterium]